MDKRHRGKLATVFVLLCVLIFSACMTFAGCTGDGEQTPPRRTDSKWMGDIYADYFPIGAAVMPSHLDTFAGLMPHFSSITAENDMKWRVLEPTRGTMAYGNADKLVSWAKTHNTKLRGHCLLWYKSLPVWLGELQMTKSEALALIDAHAKETVAYFGSEIYAWDVLNEAISNTVTASDVANGTYMRTGGSEFSAAGTVDWYKLCGMDFVKQVFRSAGEARKQHNLDLDLYYNDYGLNDPNKRAACVELVKTLQKDGIPIDGVGMQAHYRLPRYKANKGQFLTNFEDSIKAYTALGVDVQITEMDICVYASNTDPQAFDALPYDLELEQGEMYGKLFEICRKYSTPWGEGYGKVTGVTTWGVADSNTAQTTASHKEYPLIFNTAKEEKKAYYEIIAF